MGIKVRGANRHITSNMIVDNTIGRIDPYGKPFEIITLKWTPRKKTFHKAKTKGFEDALITRNTQSKQISIEYRKSGSAEWLKDPIGGEFIAKIPKTDNNIRVLASMFYDNLWVIKEAHIKSEVKKLADKIDEENKKVKCPFEGFDTWFDYHKMRRESHFKGKSGMDISQRGATKAISDQLTQEEAMLEKRRIELEKKEAELKEKEEVLNDKISQKNSIDSVQLVMQKYDRDFLEKLNVSTLKKKARDEFNIKDAFERKKPEIIDIILDLQSGEQFAPEIESEPEVITG